MKAKVIPAILLLCVFVFVSFPFILLVDQKTAYYAYKEITYKTLADKLAGRARSPEQAAMMIQDYFHHEIYTPLGAKVVDKDTFNDLVRGVAFCDQRAWGMSALLGKRGIGARMVITQNPAGGSNHTVLEALIGGRWCLFDPNLGFVIKGKDGKIYSYEEICADPSLFYESERMLKLREVDPASYGIAKEFLTKNVYYVNPRKPIVWKSQAKSRNPARSLLVAALDLYFSVFGRRASDLFQDIYLNLFSAKSGYNELFFRARNYDIYGRDGLAAEFYRKFIGQCRQDPNIEDAKFFLGVLYTRRGEVRSAIETFQMLLRESKGTEWKRKAYYYIGYNHELAGETAKAKDFYLESIALCKMEDPESAALKILELDAFERLDNLK